MSIHYNSDLTADYNGILLQEECEMTGEIEASSEPSPLRHIELSTSFVGKRPQIEHCILKGHCVQSNSISDRSKLRDGHTVWPWRRDVVVVAVAITASTGFNGVRDS